MLNSCMVHTLLCGDLQNIFSLLMNIASILILECINQRFSASHCDANDQICSVLLNKRKHVKVFFGWPKPVQFHVLLCTIDLAPALTSTSFTAIIACSGHTVHTVMEVIFVLNLHLTFHQEIQRLYNLTLFENLK